MGFGGVWKATMKRIAISKVNGDKTVARRIADVK